MRSTKIAHIKITSIGLNETVETGVWTYRGLYVIDRFIENFKLDSNIRN